MSVSLPANAGVASPPTPALGPVSAAYAPPVPTVALAPGQESPSSSPTVFFDVQFASSVSGLTAGDFVTHSGPLQSYADSLSGSGASYTLAVVVVDRCSWLCPPGYTPSATVPGTDVFCTKKVAPATWTQANDACAPFTLASAASSSQLDVLAAQAGGEETWCGVPPPPTCALSTLSKSSDCWLLLALAATLQAWHYPRRSRGGCVRVGGRHTSRHVPMGTG